jgi:hypothetical protein
LIRLLTASVGPLDTEVGIAVGIELADGLLRLPHGGHDAVRVPGSQQANELLPSLVVQPLLRLGQQAPAPIEGIGLVAAVAERLDLDSTPALVELGVGQVGSDRGAVPLSPAVGLPGPSPEPDMQLPPHPALHEPMPPDYAASSVTTHGEGIVAPR